MEKKLDTCIASMVAAIDEQGNKFYLMISPNADVYPKFAINAVCSSSFSVAPGLFFHLKPEDYLLS